MGGNQVNKLLIRKQLIREWLSIFLYFSEWWMNIEEEGVVYIPTAHLSKMGLIPTIDRNKN